MDTESEATYKQWKYRTPPDGRLMSQLMKCILPQPCAFKDTCPDAHSEDELEEWKVRLLVESKMDGYVDQTIFSVEHYRNLINDKLNELEEGGCKKLIMSEIIGSQSVISDENLFIMHVEKGKELAWMFTVTSLKIPPDQTLERVFLMNDSPEFSIAYVFYPESENINPLRLPDGCMLWENEQKDRKSSGIQILLRFFSSYHGIFHQQLIFDFGHFPKLVRNLGVQVANDEYLSLTMKYDPQIYTNDELTWMDKHKIIYFDGTETDEQIRFPLPKNLENLIEYGAFKHLDTNLSKQNYRFHLHTLLYIEEYQRRADLQSITLHLDDLRACLDEFDSEHSINQTATVLLDEYIIEEFTRLVGRSGNALVRLNKYESDDVVSTESVVYQVVIQNIKYDALVLELSENFSSILHSSTDAVDVDICFCLVDVFQSLHNAVENIDLRFTFPSISLHQSLPPTTLETTDENLSHNQMKALNVVLEPSEKPPILLLGPFGSGKTRTIAEIIEKLMSSEGKTNRILVCTHSNSAADYYIEEYFHPLHLKNSFGQEIDPWMIPLRINWKYRYVSTVSDKVLPYCFQNKETGLFDIPTKEEVEKHSLIISTLMTSEILFKLDLPVDFFSHIFIDEAAQAMEVEALLPLLLATKKTKILLAGDHMQMSEPLSSNVAESLGLGKSLLERLFEYYPFDAECKLKLLENFRSYKEIVDLSSHLFYEDSLLSNKIKPDFEKYPVEFHGVDGFEIISKDHPSYENYDEAAEVLTRLLEIQLFWEFRGVPFDLSKVCVVSFYPAQVRRIRKVLRHSEMNSVHVESVNNIQGREFDVLIISTVRTLCDTTLFDENCGKDIGFLTNPKLLNTALTRACYQVIIIGDPLALCSIGECKGCWKTLISCCEENETFFYRMDYNELLENLKIAPVETNGHQRQSFRDEGGVIEEDPPESLHETVNFSEENVTPNPSSPPPAYEASIFSLSTPGISANVPLVFNSVLQTSVAGIHHQWPPSSLPVSSAARVSEMEVAVTQSALTYGYPQPLLTYPNQVASVGNTSFTYPVLYRGPSKVFLPPSKTLFDLRQKINFVQKYSFHLLDIIDAKPNVFMPVIRSGSISLQKVDELSRNYEICQPRDLEINVFSIECEVEKCYLFADDQFNKFTKEQPTQMNCTYSDEVARSTYNQLKNRLSDFDLFLTNESFKVDMLYTSDRHVARLKKDIYSLSCQSILISYQLELCQLLMSGSSATLLNAKLDFIEQSICNIEASQEEFHSSSKPDAALNDFHDLESSADQSESVTTNFDLQKSMETLAIHESDPDVNEWFAKRRNDSCVQEYIISNDRHFASKLSSPPPVVLQKDDLYDEADAVDIEQFDNYDYSMRPAYTDHIKVDKAKSLGNVFEGKITYDYTEDPDRIHGKVLVNNMLQVHINGLRHNNRALPDDRVIVALKKHCDSITFDIPGEVICVTERSSQILTCRKINSSLVIPVKKHGPPILLVRGVGVGRRKLDSNTLYKVKIVHWPNDMRYPIGNIINMGRDMT